MTKHIKIPAIMYIKITKDDLHTIIWCKDNRSTKGFIKYHDSLLISLEGSSINRELSCLLSTLEFHYVIINTLRKLQKFCQCCFNGKSISTHSCHPALTFQPKRIYIQMILQLADPRLTVEFEKEQKYHSVISEVLLSKMLFIFLDGLENFDSVEF